MGTNKIRTNHGYKEKYEGICLYIASCMRPLVCKNRCCEGKLYFSKHMHLCICLNAEPSQVRKTKAAYVGFISFIFTRMNQQ